jgi:hypothetical protein
MHPAAAGVATVVTVHHVATLCASFRRLLASAPAVRSVVVDASLEEHAELIVEQASAIDAASESNAGASFVLELAPAVESRSDLVPALSARAVDEANAVAKQFKEALEEVDVAPGDIRQSPQLSEQALGAALLPFPSLENELVSLALRLQALAPSLVGAALEAAAHAEVQERFRAACAALSAARERRAAELQERALWSAVDVSPATESVRHVRMAETPAAATAAAAAAMASVLRTAPRTTRPTLPSSSSSGSPLGLLVATGSKALFRSPLVEELA